MENDIPKEFIQRYVSNRQKDLLVLKEFLAGKNYSEIAKKAHIIKGNAASFGFADLGGLYLDILEIRNAIALFLASIKLC